MPHFELGRGGRGRSVLAHTRQITPDGLSDVRQRLAPRPALAVTPREGRTASNLPAILIGFEHHKQLQSFTAAATRIQSM